MQFQTSVMLAIALSASFSLNVLAAPYPFTVESQLVNSSYTYTDPTNDGFSDVVSWTPAMGNFSFDLMAIQAYGTITNFYAAPGTYILLANSDIYWPASSVTWNLNAGQVGLTGVIDWNSNKTDFVVVWDVMQNGAITNYLATDLDGDGIRGFRLVNGPFNGFNFALDATLAAPVPSAVWLLGSGLLGLIGVVRRKGA
jgi:hypothetical protein